MRKYISDYTEHMRTAFIADADGGAKSRRNIVVAGTMESIAIGVTTGAFYTALIQTVFAGESAAVRNAYLGWIVSLGYLARAMQVLVPFLSHRIRSWKRFYRWTRGAYFVLQCALIPVIACVQWSASGKAVLLLGTVISSEMLYYLSNPLLCKWYMHNVPQEIYPDWFSGQQLMVSTCTTLAVIGVSLAYDRFVLAQEALLGIVVLRALAILPGFFEIRANANIRMPNDTCREERPRLKATLAHIFRNRAYCRILLLSCIWSYILLFPGQYFVSYMLTELSLSYTFVNISMIIGIPLSLFIMPFWLYRIHRYGWYKPFAWISLVYALIHLMFVFVFRDTAYLYILGMLMAQFIAPGANTIVSSLPFQAVPQDRMTSYLAIFNVLCNLSRFLGAYSGKAFMSLTQGHTLSIASLSFTNGQYICLVCMCFYLLFAILARRYAKGNPSLEGEQS